MAAFTPSAHLLSSSLSTRHSIKPTIVSSLTSQNPNPNSHSISPSKSQPKSLFNHPISRTAALTSSSSLFLLLISGDGGGGGGFFNGGGGGGGNGGHWWSNFLSPIVIAKDDETQGGWDSHGLPVNIVVQLNKLSGFKKYKVSDILFFDQRRRTTIGNEDSFFEMVSLRPGGVYTKTQLQKELETLATCGMFERVDIGGGW